MPVSAPSPVCHSIAALPNPATQMPDLTYHSHQGSTKVSQGAQSTREIPLKCLDLVAKGNCIFGSYASDSSWQATISKGLHWQQTKTTPGFPMKKLQPEGRFQVYHTWKGYRSALSEHRLKDTIFELSAGLTTACWHFSERSSNIPRDPWICNSP